MENKNRGSMSGADNFDSDRPETKRDTGVSGQQNRWDESSDSPSRSHGGSERDRSGVIGDRNSRLDRESGVTDESGIGNGSGDRERNIRPGRGSDSGSDL
jgi:hypothetical protein